MTISNVGQTGPMPRISESNTEATGPLQTRLAPASHGDIRALDDPRYLLDPVFRSISNNELDLLSLIQTDAAINPGNSGGPLHKLGNDQPTLTNDVNRFLLLMLDFAKEMRSSSREIRQEQTNAIVKAKEGAIEQMTLSAKHTYDAAITAGVGRIASGFCNIAGGIGGSNANMAIGKGAGEAVGGSFDIGAAAAKNQAAQADIARANWDKVAEVAQTAQSNANDTVREMLDLIKSIQQVLQQNEQSRVDTAGKISQRF